MSNRKGQAAMEFLMTYGWAILAAVIAVGALWWLMSSSGGTVSFCSLSAPLSCEEQTANTTSVIVVFRNGVGDAINVTQVNATGGCTAITPNENLADGSTYTAVISCSGLTVGDSVQEDLSVKYIKSGGSLEQTSTGTVSTEVVA